MPNAGRLALVRRGGVGRFAYRPLVLGSGFVVNDPWLLIVPMLTEYRKHGTRLELPMALLAITVLVAARRVGCFSRQTIMRQQGLVLLRENFRVAIRMHRQRQPIRAVP